jgi:signal transduction histidine kinase
VTDHTHVDDDFETTAENSFGNTAENTFGTTVSNTDVYGSAQRDHRDEKLSELFSEERVRVDHSQSEFDSDREMARRHAEEEHSQRMRFTEDIHALTLQTLAAANTSTTVADAAVVDSLVGIIDKLTSLVPPVNTGKS